MKNSAFFARPLYLAFVLLLSLLVGACSDKGKVETVNMLYGAESKVWKTAKQTDATGDKVNQTDANDREELHLYANGNYTMTGPSGVESGKYTFDQAAKTFAMTKEGATQSNNFTVETLTDDKFTLVAPSGAKLQMEKE